MHECARFRSKLVLKSMRTQKPSRQRQINNDKNNTRHHGSYEGRTIGDRKNDRQAVEKSFGRDGVALCATCQKPQMLHATKDESDNWKPTGAAHKLLEENDKVSEVQYSLAPSS